MGQMPYENGCQVHYWPPSTICLSIFILELFKKYKVKILYTHNLLKEETSFHPCRDLYLMMPARVKTNLYF
jgi:hypothetical protein